MQNVGRVHSTAEVEHILKTTFKQESANIVRSIQLNQIPSRKFSQFYYFAEKWVSHNEKRLLLLVKSELPE